MNILLTGARAPICADIARTLCSQGHVVWVADCLRFPLAKFSKNIAGYVRLKAPNNGFNGFASEVIAACIKHRIDAIIPTCEEVFWLAKIHNLPAHTLLRTASLATLNTLHNKASFNALANQLGYGAGDYFTVQSASELTVLSAQLGGLQNYVAKPIYSRFASQTLISPSARQISQVVPSPEQPWLIQPRAIGQEYCCYALAEKGQLLGHVAYLPKYRLGANGASVYFAPAQKPALKKMCAEIIAAIQFTGQISFDVIETAKQLVALECNPRGTSGAHLLAQQPALFTDALLGKVSNSSMLDFKPTMLALPLISSHPALLFSKTGRADFNAANDAMKAANVPIWAQALGFAEVLVNAMKNQSSIIKTSTQDIEWNGDAELA